MADWDSFEQDLAPFQQILEKQYFEQEFQKPIWVSRELHDEKDLCGYFNESVGVLFREIFGPQSFSVGPSGGGPQPDFLIHVGNAHLPVEFKTEGTLPKKNHQFR